MSAEPVPSKPAREAPGKSRVAGTVRDRHLERSQRIDHGAVI